MASGPKDEGNSGAVKPVEQSDSVLGAMALTGMDRLSFLLARIGPVGKSPHAPGTSGAFVAALAASWIYLPLPFWARLLVLGLIFLVGGLSATRVENVLQVKDPGEIVLDEFLGQLVAYSACSSLGYRGLILGFLLFRAFDIAKPGPVRASELWLPSGWGVMIDDVVAGLFAMSLLFGAKLFWPDL